MLAAYIAIGIYLSIIIFITWMSARTAAVDGFLYASHDVSWLPLSVSIFSSVLSSYNFVVILTFAFLYGPYVILIFLGVLVAFWGIYLIAKKYQHIIRKQNFSNIIDFFAERFDHKVATILNLAFIFALLLFITLQLFVNTTIFSAFLGWGKYVSALFVGLIVFAYTTIGGLNTEIFTDVFQGILMLTVGVLVFMVDTSVITSDVVVGILSNTEVIIAAVSLGFAQLLTLLVQPEMWQRVAAARSLQHLKKAFVSAWILLVVIVIPLIIIGLAAKAGGGIENPGNILAGMLKDVAPTWYLPVLITSLFAALMSTIDSSLFAISSQVGKHGFLVGGDKAEAEEASSGSQSVARRTRITVGLVTVITLIASLFLGNFLSGVFQLVSLLTVVSTAVVLSFVYNMSATETFISLLVGIGVFVTAFFGGYITDQAITTLYPSLVLVGYASIQTVLLCAYRKL